MRRNLAPFGGCFHSNRNGRIVGIKLFMLSLILFIVILQGKGNYIFTLVPSINPVSAIPAYSFFVHQITLTQGEQLSTFLFPC